MEENFEALLEMYMNEEEINEKIKSDNEEIKEEEQNSEKVSESKKDIRKYKIIIELIDNEIMPNIFPFLLHFSKEI